MGCSIVCLSACVSECLCACEFALVARAFVPLDVSTSPAAVCKSHSHCSTCKNTQYFIDLGASDCSESTLNSDRNMKVTVTVLITPTYAFLLSEREPAAGGRVQNKQFFFQRTHLNTSGLR